MAAGAPVPESRHIAELKRDVATAGRTAVSAFWRELEHRGTPIIEPVAGDPTRSLVTVVWRGDDATENVVASGGLFGLGFPALQRVPGSDVWYITRTADTDLRTQYAFYVNAAGTIDGAIETDSAAWSELARSAVWLADPFNPERIDFGMAVLSSFSVLEMPAATPQPWCKARDGVAAGSVEPHRFQSDALGNARVIWTYLPPGYAPDGEPYPLLVLYDGFAYLKIGIQATLDNLIAEGRIPPMICAMVHQLDRETELPCNDAFASSMARELVREWLPARYHVTDAASRTIIGGCSLGGLAASFAASRHPDVFGNVLSQSGSYWWGPGGIGSARMDDATVPWYWLTAQYASSPRLDLRFYMDVGRLEVPAHPEVDPDMVATNRRFRDTLLAKGYPVIYQEFAGGHDYACWRGTLADGLLALTAGW